MNHPIILAMTARLFRRTRDDLLWGRMTRDIPKCYSGFEYPRLLHPLPGHAFVQHSRYHAEVFFHGEILKCDNLPYRGKR